MVHPFLGVKPSMLCFDLDQNMVVHAVGDGSITAETGSASRNVIGLHGSCACSA